MLDVCRLLFVGGCLFVVDVVCVVHCCVLVFGFVLCCFLLCVMCCLRVVVVRCLLVSIIC